MVSSSPVAVCRVAGTTIEWASDQLALLFREPPGSFKGREISGLFPDQSAADRALREMTLHKDPDGLGRTEARFIRSDGTEIFCRMSLRQVDPDDITRGVLLSVTDITEVVVLREQVRQLEVRYRELQQISGTIIMRTDPQGKILFMNKAGLELFGYSDREILGKTVVETIMVPGADGVPGGDPFAAPVTHDESGMHISEHVRRNGDLVFVAWTARPVSGQEGEGTETLCFGHDITDYEHPGFGRISTASWRDPILSGTDVEGDVFDAVFHICTEIVREGREGHKVGTTFILGDAGAVMEQSRQLGLNPFEGHPEGRRTVTNPDTKENIKEFATMDGAFVVNGYGVFEAARRYLTAPAEGIDIPEGFGTRHRSAAAMTKATRSIAFVVSESGGRISILRDGRIVKLIS
jgi:PAS domain S-box-containing protein